MPEPTRQRRRPAHAAVDACRRASSTSRRRRRPRRRRRRPARPSVRRGADEGQPRLLVAVEDLDVDAAARRAPRPRARRGWRRRGCAAVATAASARRAELARPSATCVGHDLGHLVDLRRRDPPVVAQARADARERALLAAPRAARRRAGSATSSRVVFEPMSMQAQTMEAGPEPGGWPCDLMWTMSCDPAIEVTRPAQALRRRSRPCAASTSRSLAARCSGCSAPTAPARRRRWRSSRATASAAAARCACSASTPQRGRARCASGWGSCCRATGMYRHITVREAVAHWAGLYPHPRDVDEVIALAGLQDGAGHARAGAVRRPDAPAGLRARAGRRPRADLPRRADDGLRPGRAAQRVGRRPLAAGAGQDRAADHALPRRGPGAGRPRGDHQGRRDPGRGRARRARRGRVQPLPRGLARRAAARATSG